MTNEKKAVLTYSDRSTGQVFADPFAMVDAYLERYRERTGIELERLDAKGYTMVRRGSAAVAVNVLDEHGMLLLLAHVMPVPATGREAFYRRLLELSFLATGDASFAIDAERDAVFVRAIRRLSGLEFEEFEDLLVAVGRVCDEWDDTLRKEFAAPT